MTLKAFISSCSGAVLNAREKSFFADTRPCGLILFQRNCESPEQVKRLIGDARDAVGADRFLVLVDQEGGRVQRLRPPHWRDMPSARAFGRLYDQDKATGLRAARLAAQITARELSGLGFNVNCAPVLDVPAQGAHDVIGNRAFGSDVKTVVALGRAVAEGLLAGGVLPVIKHMPGHGRAKADSHFSLPKIEADAGALSATDFAAFAALNDLPLAMTAHVLLTAYDAAEPASTSAVIMSQVIRGLIGFDGLVMSDDLSMGALGGSLGDRTKRVIAAGVDVALHCNGALDEMIAVADAAPQMGGKTSQRYERAFAALRAPQALDMDEAETLLDQAFAAMPAV